VADVPLSETARPSEVIKASMMKVRSAARSRLLKKS
jgi:hypothetical protein